MEFSRSGKKNLAASAASGSMVSKYYCLLDYLNSCPAHNTPNERMQKFEFLLYLAPSSETFTLTLLSAGSYKTLLHVNTLYNSVYAH